MNSFFRAMSITANNGCAFSLKNFHKQIEKRLRKRSNQLKLMITCTSVSCVAARRISVLDINFYDPRIFGRLRIDSSS